MVTRMPRSRSGGCRGGDWHFTGHHAARFPDEDPVAARDRAVSRFNDYVDKTRAWLIKAAMLEILSVRYGDPA